MRLNMYKILNNANIKNWLIVIQCKFPDKSSFPKMSKQRYNLMKRIYVFIYSVIMDNQQQS